MVLRILSFLLLFMVFLAGCINTNSTAVPDSVVRQPDDSTEVYGEVGAMYGASASDH
jgi:PBP1b-binding outer membrane lipoprotein LpoB